MSSNIQVKIIDSDGQLFLGKEFAGKMVLIDPLENGTWIIKAGEVAPESEKWLHKANAMAKLDQALDWAAKNKPV